MKPVIKLSVFGLFFLSNVALADNFSEAIAATISEEVQSVNSSDNAQKKTDDAALAIPCGENTGYRLLFVAHSSQKGFRTTEFLPAEYLGKQIYCKKSGLVLPDGMPVSDAQLGEAYFATVYNRSDKPNKELLDSDKNVSDPELKELIAESHRKLKKEIASGIIQYGKKVRTQASAKTEEAN